MSLNILAFFAWLEPMPVLMDSQSALFKAIQYSLNQKEYLLKFLDDGNIPIDNNASERAIKPFVMGRKAWLFCNTPNGAEASAIIYSIVETAKANGCNPYSYLCYLLETIPNHMDDTNLDFIEHLLPWADALLLSCKTNRISDSDS